MSPFPGALGADASVQDDERSLPDTSAGSPGAVTAPAWRRSRVVTAALVVLALLLVAGGVAVLALPKGSQPGTPLGAAGSVPGGLARINGILPTESDGWLPPDGSAVLEQPAAEGAHRVRILLELTAIDAEGIDFSSADYSVAGLGSGQPPLLWAEPADATLQQGQSVTATLVFEIPDQAVELTLDGPSSSRLALGVGHHTPGN